MSNVKSLSTNCNGSNAKRNFFDIDDDNFDAPNASLKNQIYSEIKHFCHLQGNEQWHSHTLGYDSIFFSKTGIEQYFRKQCGNAVRAIFLEESNKKHKLFGQILSDNYDAVAAEFGITETDEELSQFILEMDLDDLRDFAIKIINVVAKRPLVANGYFSYSAWEDEIKKQWLN